MEHLLVLLLFWGAIALLASWIWARVRRRIRSRPPERRAPEWSDTDFEPTIDGWEAHGRAPDLVEHELDLSAEDGEFRYRVLATWTHDDPYAESSRGIVREEYDARLEDDGWKIRLVKRNGTETDGHPWEPAPRRFAGAWTRAYRSATARRSADDRRASARSAGRR